MLDQQEELLLCGLVTPPGRFQRQPGQITTPGFTRKMLLSVGFGKSRCSTSNGLFERKRSSAFGETAATPERLPGIGSSSGYTPDHLASASRAVRSLGR